MSIQYAGGTIINTTFTGAVKQDIVSALNTQLKLAGWTAISGDGTTDVLLESATTPAGNSIRVRLRSTNLTNCASVVMQNAIATRVATGGFLLPTAGKTFRIIANKYQFFCFTPGTSAAREFVALGVPYIPSFLEGVITGDLGWTMCNAGADTATTVVDSLRTCLGLTGNIQSFSGIVSGGLFDHVNTFGTLGVGDWGITIPCNARLVSTTSGYRWHDDSLLLSDPLITWGASAPADEAKIRGQLWDAMVASDGFTVDTLLSSVDGHDWHGITGGNYGTLLQPWQARGTLFVATS